MRPVTTLVCAVLVNGWWGGENGAKRRGDALLANLPLQHDWHTQRVNDSLQLAKAFPKEAKLAVFWAGIPAYFTDFRMVDFNGYNDRHIAHLSDVFPQRIAIRRC